MNVPIARITGEPVLDIALDTIRIGKQALIFVNSKRGAESTAEKLAKKTGKRPEAETLKEQVLNALSSPTKQCQRLAYCVERGVAFHHAGLSATQRHLVEDAFLAGTLTTIAATPTLAAGVNLPAYRVIVRDLQRFSGAGMVDIPVLEYAQMSGRAGRPDFHDDHGEAITIAKNENDAVRITEQYLNGTPEAIYSKVAALPVLRTHCLSLIASEVVQTRDELHAFFLDTFFAHQYGDIAGITGKLDETIAQLQTWGFLEGATDDFVSAASLHREELRATPLGKRVSELYIDPYSAHHLIAGLRRTPNAPFFAYLHLVCSTIEMRPLLRLKLDDYELLEHFLEEHELMLPAPSVYDHDYDGYLSAVKTARLLNDWCEERREQELLENYHVRPGELKARLDIADWLCYGAGELARILGLQGHLRPLVQARTRIKYGVRAELLPLLAFTGIGRVRARTLFRNGIRNAGDVKRATVTTLTELLGPALAQRLKEQVGETVAVPSPQKRTGQLSLDHRSFR